MFKKKKLVQSFVIHEEDLWSKYWFQHVPRLFTQYAQHAHYLFTQTQKPKTKDIQLYITLITKPTLLKRLSDLTQTYIQRHMSTYYTYIYIVTYCHVLSSAVPNSFGGKPSLSCVILNVSNQFKCHSFSMSLRSLRYVSLVLPFYFPRILKSLPS